MNMVAGSMRAWPRSRIMTTAMMGWVLSTSGSGGAWPGMAVWGTTFWTSTTS